MTNEQKVEPHPVGTESNPLIPNDIEVIRPERFTLVKTSHPGQKEDSYVIALVESDVIPINTSEGLKFKQQYTTRVVIEVGEAFMKSLAEISQSVKSPKEIGQQLFSET